MIKEKHFGVEHNLPLKCFYRIFDFDIIIRIVKGEVFMQEDIRTMSQGGVDESVVMNNTLVGAIKAGTAGGKGPTPGQAGTEAASRNKPEKLEWLQDAGLGLFIHWSLDAQLGCVISHSLVGASEDYTERFFNDLPQTLDAKGWDFDHIAGLAKLAGFRYAVLTTKHHCGFCLWPTETTEFHIGNTPCGRNLVKEFADAMRRKGIKVGLYFSPEDFNFLRNEGLTITRTPVEPYSEEVIQRYRAYLKAQMLELMQNFGPVDVMFFDGGESMVGADGVNLQQYCINIAWDIQPDVLITRGAIPTPEQQLPGVGADTAWEGCITLGTAWQYQPTNEIYKTGRQTIKLIADTRARGGALLLNIGPDANGVLCREQENILREVSLWHFINHEAVHNTRPWIITNEEDTVLLKAKDDSAVYAILFGVQDWDRGQRREILLHSVYATEQTQVSILGQSGELTEYRSDLDAHTYHEQRSDGLHISAMNAQRIYCGGQWRGPLVLKITHPKPAFEPLGVQTLSEGIKLLSGGARLSAEVLTLGSFDEAQLTFEYRVYPGFAMASYEDVWQAPEAQTIDATGIYSMEIAGLTAGVTYQYRAVLKTEINTMRGEMALLVAE